MPAAHDKMLYNFFVIQINCNSKIAMSDRCPSYVWNDAESLLCAQHVHQGA